MTSFTPSPSAVEQVDTLPENRAARPHVQPLPIEKRHQSPTAFNQNAKPSVTLEALWELLVMVMAPTTRQRKLSIQLAIKAKIAVPSACLR